MMWEKQSFACEYPYSEYSLLESAHNVIIVPSEAVGGEIVCSLNEAL